MLTFTVTEHDGIARNALPVTGGIPIVQGAVADVAKLELHDDRGEPVSLQARATSRWPDGSVRWVLLDFPVEVGALQTREYRLAAGQASAGAEVEAVGLVDGEPLPRRVGEVAVSGSRLQVA